MAGTWSLGRIWIKFPVGHPMHGLEVLMRRRLIREPDVEEFSWRTDEQLEAMEAPEKRAYLTALTEYRCTQFGRLLIKWNLTEPEYDEDGEETGEVVRVPPTIEGVGHLDADTFTALWRAYDEAVTVVAPPLPQRSGDGEPSEVESTMQQEPSSPSLRTLDTL